MAGAVPKLESKVVGDLDELVLAEVANAKLFESI